MRYATIKFNDASNSPGIGVSLYTQGCPHHCKGCFNQETWDFNGGKPFTKKEENLIIEKLQENGIKRNLNILGGEPLCSENIEGVADLVKKVKEKDSSIKIYIWTGYTYEVLLNYRKIYQDYKPRTANEKIYAKSLETILSTIDCLIDGEFIEEEKDLTLEMRGSKNQKIIKFDK